MRTSSRCNWLGPSLTCCHTNGQRGLALFPLHAFATGDDGAVALNFFLDSAGIVVVPRAGAVEVSQESERADGSRIVVRLAAEHEGVPFPVAIRHPNWASSLRINGRPARCRGKECRVLVPCRGSARLELEFERLYLKLFLPSMRHGTAGARKRYAGLVEEGGEKRVIFVGMESVRSDWTDLSKEFQKGLYERVFSGEPVEDFVREYVERLKSGGCDDLLVYRKVLRKPLDQYVETTPPHVKAARMLPKPAGRLVRYVMTVDGPQPAGFRESPFDYEHYVEKQLEPVADAVLAHLGTSFRAILGGERQMSLF